MKKTKLQVQARPIRRSYRLGVQYVFTTSIKLTWLALGVAPASPCRSYEQRIALSGLWLARPAPRGWLHSRISGQQFVFARLLTKNKNVYIYIDLWTFWVSLFRICLFPFFMLSSVVLLLFNCNCPYFVCFCLLYSAFRRPLPYTGEHRWMFSRISFFCLGFLHVFVFT